MNEIVVVCCAASKLKGEHKAKDLYIGNLFKRGRILAEASGLPWCILSAEHGLISPDTVIRDYENRIAKNDKSILFNKLEQVPKVEKVHCIDASNYAPLCYAFANQVVAACAYFVGNPGTTRLYVEYRDLSLNDIEEKFNQYVLRRSTLVRPSNGQPAKGVNCRAIGKITGKLWNYFDATLNQSSLLPKFHAFKDGIEDATVRIQYMKYHRFYNLPLCGSD